jgi:hypothetical protein
VDLATSRTCVVRDGTVKKRAIQGGTQDLLPIHVQAQAMGVDYRRERLEKTLPVAVVEVG